MRTPLVLALLLSASALLGPAVAVNPLDNDAGSGGDAGDLRDVALPVEPGAFFGRVITPVDMLDTYVFYGQPGQVARLAFRATGPAEAWLDDAAVALPGGEAEVLLATPGPHYVQVAAGLALLDPSVRLVTYHVQLELVAPAAAAWDVRHGLANVGEAAWEVPAEGAVMAQAALPYQPQDAMSATIVFEWSAEEEGRQWWVGVITFLPTGSYSGSGLGYTLRTTPAALPDVVVPVVEVEARETVITIRLERPGLQWARVAVHASLPSDLVLTFLSDGAFAHRFRADAASFTWDERNSGAEVQVLAPGLSVTAPRVLEHPMTERNVAFLDTAGWQGSFTDPDGRTTVLDTLHPTEFILFPGNEGLWTFRLGPTVGVGLGAVHRYLYVVEVPHLGVAPA